LGSIYKFVVNLILPNILPTKKGICFVEKKSFFFWLEKKKMIYCPNNGFNDKICLLRNFTFFFMQEVAIFMSQCMS
jgi:hypothetical protein